MKKKNTKQEKKTLYLSVENMLVVGLVFCLMIVALYFVQASVPYSMRNESIPLISKEEIVSAKETENEAHAKYVILDEPDDEMSKMAMQVIEPILEQMKIPFEVYTARGFEVEKLEGYECFILAVNHYSDIAGYLGEIKSWVKRGGSLMVLFPPEYDGNFMALFDVFGIKDCGTTEIVNEISFRKGFMIGGDNRSYPITDAFPSSYALTVSEDSEVYMQTTDEYPIPLIWKKDCGEGAVVFNNFGIMEKAYRGIHGCALSLLEDVFVYPVINGAAFYIDDFPAPVPEGDGTYITRDFNMSVSDFYSQVWWNDVYDLGKVHDIKYTGLVIEEYSNRVEEPFETNDETDRYLYFGNMLLQSGGEIGIHGYNHMPLVLDNFDYEDQYDDYKQWPSEENMRLAFEEAKDFTNKLFPQEKLKVYVPPSNILSQEGRQMLSDQGIEAIASVYIEGDLAYAQEFDVSTVDGIVNTPRVISGYVFHDYIKLLALCELNFHLVSTHFQHPDDVLDEDRGAELGWKEMKSRLADYMNWLYESCPQIRNLTGSELAAAVERYDVLSVERITTEEGLHLEIENFYDEVFMILRVNDGKCVGEVKGGTATMITEGCYLIACVSPQVDILIQ